MLSSLLPSLDRIRSLFVTFLSTSNRVCLSCALLDPSHFLASIPEISCQRRKLSRSRGWKEISCVGGPLKLCPTHSADIVRPSTSSPTDANLQEESNVRVCTGSLWCPGAVEFNEVDLDCDESELSDVCPSLPPSTHHPSTSFRSKSCRSVQGREESVGVRCVSRGEGDSFLAGGGRSSAG